MAVHVVRAMSFKCIDESGVDWLGSDEPYWVFTAIHEDGSVVTSRSKVWGDIDSGETRKFKTGGPGAGENIIWPGKGRSAGAPGPVILSIQLWESDQGAADEIQAATEKVFKAAAAAVAVPGAEWAALVSMTPEVVRKEIVRFVADDLMGSRTVTLTEGRLRRLLPNGGARMLPPIRFSSGQGSDLPGMIAGSPDYDLNLQIERGL